MDIIPKATCNRSYGGNVTQRQVCAAHPGGGQDACFGDSGGPLQYLNEDGKWVISGAVSWGIGCARKKLYGVYTNVKALLPFIHKVLKGMVYNDGSNVNRPNRLFFFTQWPHFHVNLFEHAIGR